MARKVRVLQVIDQLAGGGAEMLLYTLALSLDRERFELHVCGLRPTTNRTLKERIEASGVPTVEFNQRNSYDLPSLLLLVRYIRRHRIDIIHTHLLAGDVMGRMAGLLTHTPVVSTIHNQRDDLDAEPLRRQLLERWSARILCRRLIVVSDVLREEIAGWFGLPLSRVVAIPNGIDTEGFRRRAALDHEALRKTLGVGDGPVVVNVARLVPEKAQHLLVEAAGSVVKARPDVSFVVVGDGPLRGRLEEQIATLGLRDRVTLAGFRTDIPDILAVSDVFVLCSTNEGLPVALLEAMAAGCAAVVTDVGGMGSLVEPGRTGLKVPPGDPQALAGAILQLVNEPDAARSMANCAQSWVTEHFGMRAWAAGLEALYLSELRRKRR